MEKRCLKCMELFNAEFEICPHCGHIVGNFDLDSLQLYPGSILHDRYLVGCAIGEGGFGIAYIGWDKILEQKVAIKEYLPSDFSSRLPGKTEVKIFPGEKELYFRTGMKKVLDEARALAKLSAIPGIVSVKDYFEENNTAYIVMEFIEGITLQEYLKKHKRLKAEDALELLRPVFKALTYVHEAGLIHRDISTDNIMIDKLNNVKLIDFGAARTIANEQHRSISIVLKHGYAPEEQYRSNGKQGPWTDIYAISAVLYRCITGVLPESANDRLHNDSLKSPTDLGIDINLQIEKVIMKGLSIYSEDRYQTVNDMLEDLEEKTVSYFDDAFSEQNSDISNDFLPDDGAFFSSSFDGNEPYDKEADSEEMNNDFPDQSSDSTGKKKIAIIVLAALAVVVIIAAVIVFVSITKKNDYNNDKEYNTVDLTDYDQYTVDGFDASELIDETEAEKDNKISDNNSTVSETTTSATTTLKTTTTNAVAYQSPSLKQSSISLITENGLVSGVNVVLAGSYKELIKSEYSNTVEVSVTDKIGLTEEREECIDFVYYYSLEDKSLNLGTYYTKWSEEIDENGEPMIYKHQYRHDYDTFNSMCSYKIFDNQVEINLRFNELFDLDQYIIDVLVPEDLFQTEKGETNYFELTKIF